MNTDDVIAKELEAFVKEYYRKFDSREPLEAFEYDFHWSDFSNHVFERSNYNQRRVRFVLRRGYRVIRR